MNDKDKEAFEKWRLEYISTHTGYFKMIGTDDLAQVAWQAACEYKQKEINELEGKICDLKDDIKDFCSLIDYVFHFVEEQKDFFWLGDNIHSVYSGEKILIEKARQVLKELQE